MRTFFTLTAILLAPLLPAQGVTCGDCDGSGSVSISDALQAAQNGVGLITMGCAVISICDVVSSGVVDALDALRIAQHAAGALPLLTCSPIARCQIDATPVPSWPVILIWRALESTAAPVSVAVHFSTDGGVSWNPATTGAGGDGTTMLAASCFPGTRHLYAWDTRADLVGTAVAQQARLRITMLLPTAGHTCVTGEFCVDNSMLGIPGTWREITFDPFVVPPPRLGATMVYDSVRRRMILFAGGEGVTVNFNDVWAFDLATETWSELLPAGTAPPVRFEHAAIFDPIANRMVIYGGLGGDGSPVSSCPCPVYLRQDTWELDFAGSADGTWVELPLAAAEAYTFSVEAIYRSSPGVEAMVIPSGLRTLPYPLGSTGANRTPALPAQLALGSPGAAAWTALPPVTAAPPPQTLAAAVAYDVVGDRFLSFGGRVPVSQPSSLIFEIAGLWEGQLQAGGVEWIEHPFCAGPSARENTPFAVDTLRQRAVMFGGSQLGRVFPDTWFLDLATLAWRDVQPVSAIPPRRHLHVFAYDEVGDRFILFGGLGIAYPPPLGDTWELRY